MKWKALMNEASLIFSNRIWSLDQNAISPVKRRIVRFVKLIRITFDTFAENRMGFQCVALSYFVALAVVPFVAFVFAVTGGLGISDKVAEILYTYVPAEPAFVSTIIEKADNIIDTAKSGAVGLISALLFLWTILWLMFQVERVFNNVWGIRKVPRKLYKRFSFYFLILFLSPFLVAIFGFGIAAYANVTSLIGIDFFGLNFLTKVLGWAIFYAIAVFTFSVMYKYIPAEPVRYKFALKSAMVAGAIFALFQYLYLETQFFVIRINGVYGAIAAIPLFLIWMNYSWQIIIYGAELTYGYHHVDSYHIPEWDEETR